MKINFIYIFSTRMNSDHLFSNTADTVFKEPTNGHEGEEDTYFIFKLQTDDVI